MTMAVAIAVNARPNTSPTIASALDFLRRLADAIDRWFPLTDYPLTFPSVLLLTLVRLPDDPNPVLDVLKTAFRANNEVRPGSSSARPAGTAHLLRDGRPGSRLTKARPVLGPRALSRPARCGQPAGCYWNELTLDARLVPIRPDTSAAVAAKRGIHDESTTPIRAQLDMGHWG